MTWTDFLKSFLRQSTYALAFFVTLALLAEYFIPGSVTPFVDPLPLAILSLVLLSADAMRRQVVAGTWSRIVAGLVTFTAASLLIVSMSAATSKTDTLAIGAIVLALALSVVVINRRHEPT